MVKISTKSGKRKRCPLLESSFNIVLEVLDNWARELYKEYNNYNRESNIIINYKKIFIEHELKTY